MLPYLTITRPKWGDYLQLCLSCTMCKFLFMVCFLIFVTILVRCCAYARSAFLLFLKVIKRVTGMTKGKELELGRFNNG